MASPKSLTISLERGKPRKRKKTKSNGRERLWPGQPGVPHGPEAEFTLVKYYAIFYMLHILYHGFNVISP